MRRPNRRPNYTETEDILNWEIPYDYVVYKDGTETVAVNGDTGKEDSRNTDSEIVIQYAFDNGKSCFIKDGTYIIEELTLDKAFTLKGNSWFTILQEKSANKTLLTIGGTAETTGVHISDIAFKGDSKASTVGVKINNGICCTLEHIHVCCFTFWGVWLRYNHTNKLLNSLITNNGENEANYGGIKIGDDTNGCNNSLIQSNEIRWNGNGVRVSNGYVINFIANSIEGNDYHGAWVEKDAGGSDPTCVNFYMCAFELNNIATAANIRDINIQLNAGYCSIVDCKFSGANVQYCIYIHPNAWYGKILGGLSVNQPVSYNVDSHGAWMCKSNLYRTSETGTATMLNGGNSIIVAHGIAATPTAFALTGLHSEVSALYVSTIGAANFTIHKGTAGNVTADRSIMWKAEVV